MYIEAHNGTIVSVSHIVALVPPQTPSMMLSSLPEYYKTKPVPKNVIIAKTVIGDIELYKSEAVYETTLAYHLVRSFLETDEETRDVDRLPWYQLNGYGQSSSPNILSLECLENMLEMDAEELDEALRNCGKSQLFSVKYTNLLLAIFHPEPVRP